MAEEGTDPALVPGSSYPPVYVDLDWSAGNAAGDYQLGLAEQTAWWVAGLPTTQRIVNVRHPRRERTCSAVPACRWARPGRPSPSGCPPRRPREPARRSWRARRRWSVSGWPPSRTQDDRRLGSGLDRGGGDVGYRANLQATAQGGALADAMLRLPRQRVEAALASDWPGWLRATATDRQLAAALGIPLPPAPPVDKSMTDPRQPAQPICR